MNFNLIPFGLESATGQLIDVDSVQRGKSCGCVCPCCKTPLVAKKGDIKEWHFAHHTRGTYSETQDSCEYSFHLSVRMMARQLIKNELQLELPAWELKERIFRNGKPETIIKTVTKHSTVLLQNCEIEQRFHGCEVDVVGEVKGLPFAIYFTHEGRSVPIELNIPDKTRCGVITISLNLGIKFAMAKHIGKPYAEILRQRLEHDIHEKAWVYHPKYRAAAHELEKETSKFTDTPWSAAHFADLAVELNPEPQERMMKRYLCMRCNVEWQDSRGYLSCCPECNDHIKQKELGPVVQ